MKPQLYPTAKPFKRLEVFDCAEGVGMTFVSDQTTERFSEDEWSEIIADVRERFTAKRLRGTEGTDPRR